MIHDGSHSADVLINGESTSIQNQVKSDYFLLLDFRAIWKFLLDSQDKS